MKQLLVETLHQPVEYPKKSLIPRGIKESGIGVVPVSIGGPGKKMEKKTVGDFDLEVISPSILRIWWI